jgi:hypothetical protein
MTALPTVDLQMENRRLTPRGLVHRASIGDCEAELWVPKMAHGTHLARWRMGNRHGPGPQGTASDAA